MRSSRTVLATSLSVAPLIGLGFDTPPVSMNLKSPGVAAAAAADGTTGAAAAAAAAAAAVGKLFIFCSKKLAYA